MSNDNSRRNYDLNGNGNVDNYEVEISNLRQLNIELKLKMQEVIVERNSVKNELKKLQENHFETKRKEGILYNRIKELEANRKETATKVESEELKDLKFFLRSLFFVSLGLYFFHKALVYYNVIKPLW